MRSTILSAKHVENIETVEAPAVAPAIALPEDFPVEGVTLGRQSSNDGDNSGAMWFE